MGGAASYPVPGGGTSGYHVLRVQEGSPGHKAGLEAFFDFIVSINNTRLVSEDGKLDDLYLLCRVINLSEGFCQFIRLEEDNDTIKELLQNNKDKPVRCLVYSSKMQVCREVILTPNTSWGGQGLLGVSIRYCSFEKANENIWHVLDVEPKSPADLAGLTPYSDYIIGCDSVLNGRDDFYDMIEAADGQQVRLYVYNTETDSCREVKLCPNSNWGGNGLLGCDIGYGYLHRIPVCRSLRGTDTTSAEDFMLKPTNPDATNVAASQASQCPPPSYDRSLPPGTANSYSEVPLKAPTPASAYFPPTTIGSVNEISTTTFVSTIPSTSNTCVPTCHIPAPAPLPAELVHLSPLLDSSCISAGTGSISQASFPKVLDPPKPLAPQFSPDLLQNPTTDFSSNQPSATAVISLPGMPPLDVSMPPLSQLHIASTSA
ncbi:hypothetical protein P879_06519 [Paragonimus westermani]|uniref:PDZ GRASP-type domain-containing protein n=1 Tax=Paragonimus westermani TaxID=34504 RepID=A0A8T0D4V9_9TREM|nr:hypothetical protein P879_06519 [Paragonimus westermani]